MTPRLSVIIRSFNRLPALCELVAALLAQQHDSFEIVVVEQSTDTPADASARLAELEQDTRLRVLRIRPLGGAAARNKGVELMRGDIAVFIDDDDVPIGNDFLTSIEAAFREDEKLMGLTCRHVWSDSDKLSWAYRLLAPRLAMRFSRVLGLPDNFARYDQRLDGRDYVHGTGGAYRRAIFERFGGWDEDTPIEDETSLGIRVTRRAATTRASCGSCTRSSAAIIHSACAGCTRRTCSVRGGSRLAGCGTTRWRTTRYRRSCSARCCSRSRCRTTR